MGGEPTTAPLTLARFGAVLAGVSVAAQVTVAVLGPSAATASLSGPGPTRSLGLHPSDLTVPVVLWLAVGAAAAAVVLACGRYGRIARLGLDPYTSDIDDLPAMGDPVGLAYPGGWTESVSVYGPVSVTVMRGASTVSGDSLAWFVVVIQLAALAAFLATGWLLLRESGSDPLVALRRSAALAGRWQRWRSGPS